MDEKDLPKLLTKRLTYGFGNSFYLGGQLERSMQHAVGDLGKGEQSPKTLFGTVESIGKYPFCLIRRGNGFCRLLKLTVIRSKRGNRLGGRVPQMPDNPSTANRGQVYAFVQTMGVLFVRDEILRQR